MIKQCKLFWIFYRATLSSNNKYDSTIQALQVIFMSFSACQYNWLNCRALNRKVQKCAESGVGFVQGGHCIENYHTEFARHLFVQNERLERLCLQLIYDDFSIWDLQVQDIRRTSWISVEYRRGGYYRSELRRTNDGNPKFLHLFKHGADDGFVKRSDVFVVHALYNASVGLE